MNYYVIILALFLIPTSECKDTLPASNNLHTGLTERIGNFSVELLYYATQAQKNDTNLIISPMTVWTVLAVIAEGASDATLRQICYAIRITPKRRAEARKQFQNLAQYLLVNTSTVELQRFNALFVDIKKRPKIDFIHTAREYETRIIKVDFSEAANTTNLINTAISNVTHNRIPKLIDAADLSNANMVLTSALYFNGQWTVPFNKSMTTKEAFYNSEGKKIGEVNMMYNRHTYPFANIKSLQARVLELPYGSQNRLSMLIMLPNPGVSLKEMFYNFGNTSLDTVFKELKISSEEYGEDEVDCFIPSFKIQTSLDLTTTLRSMGIRDLFEEGQARLPEVSFIPTYVSKMIHKAEIEVTEEGTVAAAATASEFSNRISIIRFEANRPFCFLIIEKTTNSITFGGIYQVPSLV